LPPKKKPAAKKKPTKRKRRSRVKKKQPKRGAARTLIEGATRVKTVAETYRLTPRECEYLSALRETEDNYEIAIKMRVDESGIEKLRGSIKGKTGLPSDCLPNLGKAITSPEPCKYKLLSEVFECSKCAGIFSSKRFPYYPDDRRCADCIDLASVSKSRARRENLVRDLLQKIEQQVKRGHSTTPAVTKVIHSFNEEFGGIAEVGKSWAEQLRILIDRSPGSKLAIDQIREYAKFQFSVLQHEIQKDPEKMSDDELDSYEASLIAERLGRFQDDIFQELMRTYLNNDVLSSEDLKDVDGDTETPRIGTGESSDGEGHSPEGSIEHVFPNDGVPVSDSRERSETPASEGGEEIGEVDGSGL